MAKIHTYSKYIEESHKIVIVHLDMELPPEDPDSEQVSGSWKEVGSCVETVSQTLENARPGSKFPLFHRIGGEIPISKLEVELFAGELDKIKTSLKKLPLSEGRLVRFRKGKIDVKQANGKELETLRGYGRGKEDPAARNLYESFQKLIDLHIRMCREAKKAATGLQWQVIEPRRRKRAASSKLLAAQS